MTKEWLELLVVQFAVDNYKRVATWIYRCVFSRALIDVLAVHAHAASMEKQAKNKQIVRLNMLHAAEADVRHELM